ncbi:uncharacterized protein [Bemisia tabaci]
MLPLPHPHAPTALSAPSAPKVKPDSTPVSSGGSSIPVGIAVARQRQQSDSNVNIAPDLRSRNRSLATRLKDNATDVPNLPAMTVLSCEDHSTNSFSTWSPQPLPQWQYPSAVPLEQPLPFHPPVGFQLARDSVSGQFLLIPPTQPNLDSLQRTVVWPNNMTATQPLLLPTQPSHHVVVDRLVAVAATPSSNESSKRKSQSATMIKIEESPITGMMMSCEYSKSSQSSVTQQNGLALIQPLQNNGSPLIGQPHFSTISSSGSVLIQHISGTSSITPTLQLNPQQLSTNNTTNSLLIASAQQLSTDATTAHSLLNQHSSGSLVINTQEIGSQIIGQLSSPFINQHPALINNISMNQPFVSTSNMSSTNHQSFVNLSANNQSFVSSTNIISPNFSNHQSVNVLASSNDLHATSTAQSNFISPENMINYCRPPTINIISPDMNLPSPVLANNTQGFISSSKITLSNQDNRVKEDYEQGNHSKYLGPEVSESLRDSLNSGSQFHHNEEMPPKKLIDASVATSISSECDEDEYCDEPDKDDENSRLESEAEKSVCDEENSDKPDNNENSCRNDYSDTSVTNIKSSERKNYDHSFSESRNIDKTDDDCILSDDQSGNESDHSVCEFEENSSDNQKPVIRIKDPSVTTSRSQATSPVNFPDQYSDTQDEEREDVETMVAHILACDVGTCVDSSKPLRIKEEEYPLIKPENSLDLSGLELLSNSIEQFEHKLIVEEKFVPGIKTEGSRSLETASPHSVEDSKEGEEKKCPSPPPSVTESTEISDSENLSGLGLLCALAHQRYLEEETVEDSDHNPEHTPESYSMRNDNHNHHSYHSREAEIEAKRILASKQYSSYTRPASPEYDAAEMEMRCRMAELQKLYQQKQKELSKLTPRKYRTSESSTASNPSTTAAPVVKRGPGRPRKNFDVSLPKSPKKKDSSEDPPSPHAFGSPKKTPRLYLTVAMKRKRSESPSRPRKQRLTAEGDLSPPVLEPICPTTPKVSAKLDILKPPTLTPNKTIDKLVELKSNKTSNRGTYRFSKKKGSLQNGSRSTSPYHQDSDDSLEEMPLSPPRLSPVSASPVASPSLPSSSQKRKVGRPRKHTDNNFNNLTETLVSKTPRVTSKNNLVGLIISSKTHQNSRFKCDKSSVSSEKCFKQTLSRDGSPVNRLSGTSKISSSISSDHDEEYKPNKIRPKLKAEAKVKSWVGEEDDVLDWTSSMSPDDHQNGFGNSMSPKVDFTPRSSLKNKSPLSPHACNRKPVVPPTKKMKPMSEVHAKLELKKSSPEAVITKHDSNCQPLIADESLSCSITPEHLSADKLPLRALINIGGLFYAGQLTAIEPPDLYGLTLDGERGHRSHIHTREEILNQAVLEVKLSRMLPVGSRVCAYWSQQYRCLYPGTVAPSSSPTQHEIKNSAEKFISVEFDDGDSGRISVEDVRLLPQSYPTMVYDPNPLLTLGKRKRRISSMSCESNPKDRSLEEVSPLSASDARESSSTIIPSPDFHVNGGIRLGDSPMHKHSEDYKERKRLKKRYRRKHGSSDDSSNSSLKRERKRHRSSSNESKDKSKRHHKHKRKRHKHKHQNNVENVRNESSSPSLSPATDFKGKKTDDEEQELLLISSPSPSHEASSSLDKVGKHSSSNATDPGVDKKSPKVEKDVHSEPKKKKERQHSTENSSKMAPFLPARRLWSWAGKGYRRPGAKGRGKKEYYKSIQRGSEIITVGDCAVFLSTGRPDRPYIGRIEAMWESWGSSMVVKVKWFYHPEETIGCNQELPFPGGLFESPHFDENDVQTISHKCDVVPLAEYKQKLDREPHRLVTVYDQNDIYYLAGFYDPTSMTISFEPDIQKKK